MSGVVIFIVFMIIMASLRNGFANIKRFDIVIFVLSLCAIPLWLMTSDPTASLILVMCANILGYVPTFRKSYSKPYEEASYLYSVNFVRHGLAIFAMSNYSLLTVLAPTVFVICNGALAIFIFWRRWKLERD